MYKDDFKEEAFKVLDTWQSLDFHRAAGDLRVSVSDIRPPWRLSVDSSEDAVRNSIYTVIFVM